MKTLSKKLLNEIKNINRIYNLGIDFEKEDAIQSFKDKIYWFGISQYQQLSENFIREFQDEVNWICISEFQKLSEKFIREFKDKIDWGMISYNQKLSEKFIRDFQDKLDWYSISKYQQLSENFIREFKDKVNWHYIIIYQKLSENFIREFRDKIDYDNVYIYQKLSENFIEEFKDKISYFSIIAKYQKVSKAFIKKYNLEIPDTCWLYKSTQYKIDYIRKHTPYEVIDNSYIIAYKTARKNGKSFFFRRYKYIPGNSYKSSCNYNIDNEASFGLAAWTKEGALDYSYHDQMRNDCKLFKVLIFIKDIGAITKNNKIRCRKFTILNEEKK